MDKEELQKEIEQVRMEIEEINRNDQKIQDEILKNSGDLESLYLSMNRVEPFANSAILSIIISAIAAFFTDSFLKNWILFIFIVFIALIFIQTKINSCSLFFSKLMKTSERIDVLEPHQEVLKSQRDDLQRQINVLNQREAQLLQALRKLNC